jgi:biopolymer transport protein ExbD
MDQWSIGVLLRSTFLMERLVLIILALMLARSVLIVIRVSYLLGKSAGSTDTTSSDRSELAAELCRKLRSLRSIFSTAPYLGLLGTSLSILDTLSSGFTGSRSSVLMWLAMGIAAALLPAAAGILVAVPATCFHNYLLTRLDLLDRERSNGPLEKRRFPLNARLSVLPFALIAAPVLAMAVAAFMTFPSLHPRVGLSVHLMPIGALDTKPLSVEPLVIEVVSAKASASPSFYLNSKKTSWDELGNKLRSELRVHPLQSIICVRADADVDWKYVTDVIDLAEGLRVDVVLLTAAPGVAVSRRSTR